MARAIELFVWLFGPLIDYIAKHHRPAAMMLFVLPASYVTCLFLSFREKFARLLLGEISHEEKVQRVKKQVLERLERPEEQRRFMCTARAAWSNLSTRFASYKTNSDCIFVADFNNILELNEEKLTVTVEPLVDVEKITRYLVPRGFMLATTLEIKEATLGGLACAVGMTTASHKYGLLQETVEHYEVILGSGEVVQVTRDNEYSDLFHTIPWSHGSLCLLLQLELKIIPVKKYVKLTYTPIKTGLRDYCAQIREASLVKNPADFVEATVFSRTECVLMTADFEEDIEEGGTFNDVGRWYKPWFYTHVRAMLNKEGPQVEYIPTFSYIFRHDKSIFFTLDDQLPEEYGNHPLFRYLFGWLCPPKVQFLKLPATPRIKEEMMMERVYQDIVLPISTLEVSITKAANLFEIWPILVYPSKIYVNKGLFRQPRELVDGENYGMYYDLGVYGIPRDIKLGERKKQNTISRMREMEEFTRQVGGAPFLYADTFLSKAEFAEMFDLEEYERVRVKYQSDKHFPHVYDKTSGCQSFDWKQYVDGKTKKE